MGNDFVELKTTENQTLIVRKDNVGAIEVVHATTHIEGHIKLYIGAFKFSIQGSKEELLQKLSETR